MKFIEPIEMTDTIYTDCDLVEDDAPGWAEDTAYSKGDLVVVEHVVYESQVDNNVGKNPPEHLSDGDLEADPPVAHSWLKIDYTNKWRMFDRKWGSVTSRADSLSFTLTPGRLCNAVALLNIAADSLEIKVHRPGNVEVYHRNVDLIDYTGRNNYYNFFFLPLIRKKDVVLTDLPAFLDGAITVTLADNGNDVAVGNCEIGTKKNVGTFLSGSSASLIDWSKKEADEQGNYVVTEGPFAKEMDYQVSVLSSRRADIQNTLAKYRATPLVFIGNEEIQESLVYGFYQDLTLGISALTRCECSILVEGLS